MSTMSKKQTITYSFIIGQIREQEYKKALENYTIDLLRENSKQMYEDLKRSTENLK